MEFSMTCGILFAFSQRLVIPGFAPARLRLAGRSGKHLTTDFPDG
jgi:hypothetical protein